MECIDRVASAVCEIQENNLTIWILSRTMKWKQRIEEDQILGNLLHHFQRALQIQLYQDSQEHCPALIKALTAVWSFPLFFVLSAIPTIQMMRSFYTTLRVLPLTWPSAPSQGKYRATMDFPLPVPALTSMPRR